MKKKILIPILLVVLIAAATLFAINRRRGDDDGTLRVSGNIEVDDVEVSFRMPGRVVTRPAAEGMPIAVGAVVATLDTDELQHEIALREADVAAARAQLAELESGSRRQDLAQAQAAVRGAAAEAERWTAEVARQRELYGKNVISKRELEVAEASAETSRERVVQARQTLALLEEGPRRETIAAARARVRQASEAVAALRTRLVDATLLSPMSGVVIAEHIEPGEHVAAGTPVVTIGDLDRVWMRAYVDETDLGRVKLGQRVTVSTDTFPGKAYPGVITYISDQAEFTPKSVQTEKERVKLVYRLKIDVPNPTHELKPGMPADATLAVPLRK
jgi:HlyD family secretion protein